MSDHADTVRELILWAHRDEPWWPDPEAYRLKLAAGSRALGEIEAERDKYATAAGALVWLHNNIHNYGTAGWLDFFNAAVEDARAALDSADTTPTDAVDYSGPDPSVECAYPGCKRRLRYAAFGPQFCSKEHRDNA